MQKRGFGFFRKINDLIVFLKIITLISIILFLLFSTETLIKADWVWLQFAVPYFSFLLNIASTISDDSFKLFNAVFEFKFAIALFFLMVQYAVLNFLEIFMRGLESAYNETKSFVNRVQEKQYNNKYAKDALMEQKKVKKYNIYVQAVGKSTKIRHLSEKVFDINKENIKMNKYLISKTAVQPKIYADGFLYSFDNFDKIDNVLDVFDSMIESSENSNYVVCLQIVGDDSISEQKQLNKMIQLKLFNKIVACSDTVWRYGFVENTNYDITPEGIYQADGISIELSIFIKRR